MRRHAAEAEKGIPGGPGLPPPPGGDRHNEDAPGQPRERERAAGGVGRQLHTHPGGGEPPAAGGAHHL